MKRAKVYFIMESEDYDNYGFAFSAENISPKEIQNWEETKPWLPISFELKDGEFADYLVNDLNIPLCSSKLKQIIQDIVAKNDSILWRPIFVNSNGKSIILFLAVPTCQKKDSSYFFIAGVLAKEP